MKSLESEGLDFQQQALDPLEHLNRVFPLIADQSRFVEIYQRQRELAERAAALKGHDGADDPAIKARMRDLESEQLELNQDLDELVEDIESHVAVLPEDANLDELRDSARKFVDALRASKARETMDQAANALAEFAGTRAAERTKTAADLLEKLLGRCQGMSKSGQSALVFKPSLSNCLGNTVEQLLADMGLGSGDSPGEGSGRGGYSTRRNSLSNVGLYGSSDARGTSAGGRGQSAADFGHRRRCGVRRHRRGVAWRSGRPGGRRRGRALADSVSTPRGRIFPAHRRRTGAAMKSGNLLAAGHLICAWGLLAVLLLPAQAEDRAPAAKTRAAEPAAKSGAATPVPDPKQVGGEPDGMVQVANLVYAGSKSSQCFSDHFLIKAEQESAISTSRRFHAVKLESDDVYGFPLLIMTGEGTFTLTDRERHNLREFIERGGFLLASAGCSSTEWDRSFRREMAEVFPSRKLEPLGMDHPVFHTVYDVKNLNARHGTVKPLEGITVERPPGRDLLARWAERHRPHAGLLLLRRKRNHQRRRDQRQYSGLRSDALKRPRDHANVLAAAATCSSARARRPAGWPWVALACLPAVAACSRTPRPLEVVVSGDTAGWIVPCGCTSNQSGGLPRCASLVSECARTAQVVAVDVGGAADHGTEKLSPYHLMQLRAILLGEQAMQVAAHNLGASELRLTADELDKLADETGAALDFRKCSHAGRQAAGAGLAAGLNRRGTARFYRRRFAAASRRPRFKSLRPAKRSCRRSTSSRPQEGRRSARSCWPICPTANCKPWRPNCPRWMPSSAGRRGSLSRPCIRARARGIGNQQRQVCGAAESPADGCGRPLVGRNRRTRRSLARRRSPACQFATLLCRPGAAPISRRPIAANRFRWPAWIRKLSVSPARPHARSVMRRSMRPGRVQHTPVPGKRSLPKAPRATRAASAATRPATAWPAASFRPRAFSDGPAWAAKAVTVRRYRTQTTRRTPRAGRRVLRINAAIATTRKTARTSITRNTGCKLPMARRLTNPRCRRTRQRANHEPFLPPSMPRMLRDDAGRRSVLHGFVWHGGGVGRFAGQTERPSRAGT